MIDEVKTAALLGHASSVSCLNSNYKQEIAFADKLPVQNLEVKQFLTGKLPGEEPLDGEVKYSKLRAARILLPPLGFSKG